MKSNVKLIAWLTLIILTALIVRAVFEIVFDIYAVKYSITQMATITLRSLATGIVVLIWLGIVIRSEATSNKLPWLILLALEPFVGLGLFLTFGRSFRKSDRYVDHPLTHNGKYLTHEPKTDFRLKKYSDIDSEITDIYKAAFNSTKHHVYHSNTSIEILTNGEEKFPALLKELESAKRFILMQYYIIRTDDIGKKVLSILSEKAKSGVEVYLMYDAIGSVFLNKKYMKELKNHGVKVLANDKVVFGFFNTRVNYRNHRKLTVIDGDVGFTGGLNLGDEYNNKKNKKFGHFRDTHMMMKGSAVKSLTQLFFRDWYYNTGKLIKNNKYYPESNIVSNGLVQVIPSGPDFKHPPIRNMYVKMINNAKKSIKIMTPYIALDQEMMTSLIIASKSGVKIDIIIPGIPDKSSVYIVTTSFIEELLEEGINVYKYSPGFCHAKVFMIDDHLASCGSYNLDNRSARINFELTTLLYKDGVDRLVSDFDEDLKKSKKLILSKWQKRGLTTRLIEGLFNLFSPLV